MARRRMIDPNIWESAYDKKWTPEDFVVMTAAISSSDDEGRGRVSSLQKNVSCMISDKKFKKCLQNLSDSIMIYDKIYFFLPKWNEYQSVAHPSKSKIPEPKTKENNELGANNSRNNIETIQEGFKNDSSLINRTKDNIINKVEVENKGIQESGPTTTTISVDSDIEKEEMRYTPNFEDISEIRLSIRRLFKRFAKKEKLDPAADLEAVNKFIFDNRPEMTRVICWKVIVQSFVILYQAERTDTGYLLGIIRKKIEEKHSEILKNKNKKANNKSFVESIEDQKRQEEEDKIYVEKTMKEYREFYESTRNNPGFYNIDEEKKIEAAFLKNSFLGVAYYLEPKIESVSLSD